MQRVVMVRPNWEKGFIDKFLVCSLNMNEVSKIYPFDPEHLSHFQYAYTGDHLIRIRHHLDSSKLSEDIFLVNDPKPVCVNSKIKIGAEVEKYLSQMRESDTKLFSIFRGTEMTQVEFDVPHKLVKSFLAPLRMVDEEMYDFIICELKYSKAADCPVTWGYSSKKPKWLNVRERLSVRKDGTTVNHISEHWVLFFNDGRVTMPDLEPTKGAQIDAASQRTVKVFNTPPQPMPDDVVKAIKITIGVNEVDELLRGIALKLYRN